MIDRAQLTAFNLHLKRSQTVTQRRGPGERVETFLLPDVIMHSMLGFVLGRAVILGGVSPFGLAFLAAAAGAKKRWGWAALGMILGSFTVHSGMIPIRYLLAAVFFASLFMLFKIRLAGNILLSGAAMFECAVLSGLLVTYLSGFTLYDTMVVMFEAVLAFASAYVFHFVISGKWTGITAERATSLILLAGTTLTGVSGIYIAGVSVRGILGAAVVMAAAYLGGAGAGCAAGASLGLMYSLATLESPMMVGVLCFSGLVSGLFKPAGKVGAAAGFAAGGFVINYYINHLAEVYLYYPEVLLGAAIFLAIPGKFLNELNSLESRKGVEGFEERVRALMSYRLKEVSKVLDELSAVFSSAAARDAAGEDSNVSKVYDELGKKLCNTCHMRKTCWEKDFYKTYQSVFEAMAMAESRGKIGIRELPELIRKRCIKTRDFATVINDSVTVLKANGYWNRRLMESRALVAEQLGGVSKIIEELSDDVKSDVLFRHDLENRIMQAMVRVSMPVTDVMAMELPGGHIEVTVEKRGCMGRRECVSHVLPAISGEIGRKMVFKHTQCSLKTGKPGCVLCAVQAENYEVAVGCCTKAKNDGAVSGDTFSFNHLRGGKYMLALSDGMGTGQSAADESRAAISLLEKLLETGFNHDVAVRTVNSALMFRSRAESFATLDLMVVDLCEAVAEFVKVGACPSFIKRPERVELVRTGSLPAGIVENVDVEPVSYKLRPGDIVVMLSDGLFDSLRDRVSDPERFISECLALINTKNPQELADVLMKCVLEKTHGRIRDDITVLAAKIWERT